MFIEQGGQKGVQRPVLSPGTLAPIHPVAFLVLTKPRVFGVPVSSELSVLAHSKGQLTYEAFGLEEKQLEVTRISPRPTEGGRVAEGGGGALDGLVALLMRQVGSRLEAGPGA